MASCFAGIINRLKELITGSERIKIFSFILIIPLIALLMPGLSEQTMVNNGIQPGNQVREAAVMRFYEGPIAPPPQGNLRDPFAVPTGLETGNPERVVAGLTKSKMPEKITAELQEKRPLKEEMPVLTGIMGDGNHQIAIIRHKGISHSYHIGQMIGQYRLTEIYEKTAIVLGPQGERVLLLGR